MAFRLPNGEYVVSHDSVSFAIRESEDSVQDFLTSGEALYLLSQTSAPRFIDAFTSITDPTQIERTEVIPFSLVTAYWLTQAVAGNEKAIVLIRTCMERTLKSNADIAFKAAQAQ